jgi:hypothetical protein
MLDLSLRSNVLILLCAHKPAGGLSQLRCLSNDCLLLPVLLHNR